MPTTMSKSASPSPPQSSSPSLSPFPVPAPASPQFASQRLANIASHLLPIKTIAGDSTKNKKASRREGHDSYCLSHKAGCNSPLGIGRATAHQFAQNGAQAVYICDIEDSNLLSVQQEITSLYPSTDIHARKFDAADEEAVKAVIDEAIQQYGQLDVFFANAGTLGSKGQNGAPSLVGEIQAKVFMDTMRTNTLSVYLAVKHASKAMMKTSPSKTQSGGSIIATSSVAGIRSGAGGIDYSASKAAVISIVQTCAHRLQGTNIRCNAICPGLIQTGMTSEIWESARSRGTESRIGQLNPLKRGGRADEVARMTLFLASDESSYVNAQYIAVDGGLTGSLPFIPGKFH